MIKSNFPEQGGQSLIRWLHLVAALIVLIVAVGGITRLTESGLSITEWKPVTGAIPPLSEASWQEEFQAYKQIPQYTEVNGPAGMTLADYKVIYFWEWLHRLLARLIGIVFAVPLLWFWVKGQIPDGYRLRLLGLLALGGFQGILGWWMVSSGLGEGAGDRVSHFRLAAHLLVALLTLGALVWTAQDLRGNSRKEDRARMTGLAALTLSALAFQLLIGAFTAGLRAGHVANDWPLMQGRLFPAGVDWSQGIVNALSYDPYLIYFVHRWWAFAVVILLVVVARQLKAMGFKTLSKAIHAMFGIQILLGIATVLSGIAIWLAALHQLAGALLVIATVRGAHAIGTQK